MNPTYTDLSPIISDIAELQEGKAPLSHPHSASDIRTTAVRAQIPQGDLLFYFDSDAFPYNERPLYRTPSGYTLWFNSADATWNVSEKLLFSLPENILHTSDGNNTPQPWESPWEYDITLATLADYTQEAFKTWANKNDLLNLKTRFSALAPASIGAATAAQGAKADTSLQQGAHISAASLEVGSIAAGQTADLYVGEDGKVGIGTEAPTEKLTVNGNIDLLGSQVKNLGTPVAETDAATKGYVDNLVPQAPPTGTYTLRSVDGVLSWVEPDYKATYEEAISATSNDRWMTPLLVSQLINLRDDVLDFSLKSQFPATGEKGRIYMADSIAYLWTGDTYEKVSRDSVFNSASQPTDPQEGDRWIDSTTFIAYEYFGGNWIQTSV